MLISEIFDGLIRIDQALASITVTGIEIDSRKVTKGSLFIALKGATVDGHNYLKQAEQSGAVVLCVEEMPIEDFNTPIICFSKIKENLHVIASRFFNHPSKDMKIIGITGTNGKTSTTFYVRAILESAGIKTGLIGTIHNITGGTVEKSINTTPDALELQRLLARMRDEDVAVVVMEVSSHGLALNRVGSVYFDFAVITNLTEDHLDFHLTMENYVDAKLSILNLLRRGDISQKKFIYNNDIEYRGQVLSAIKDSGLSNWSYCVDGAGDFSASQVVANLKESSFLLKSPAGEARFNLSSRGYFTIENSLAAIAIAVANGLTLQDCQIGLKDVRIPGRFEIISDSHPFLVVVDYAHTDDALKSLIESAMKLAPNKIITVFGCGGDRDRKKRPLMGKVAAELSDYIFITNDNPRSEDPALIIEEVVSGINPHFSSFEAVEDRAMAIQKAILMARPHDIVLIAGKGHEDYQINKSETVHFSDREIAEKVLAEF